MAIEKITREQIASYLNTGTSTSPTYSLIGVGITEYGLAFNPQVETEKWIINKNASSSLESYQIQGDVAQTCYKGDAVFEYINNLRRTASVGSTNETSVLDIDMYDATTDDDGVTSYSATRYGCTIAVTNYLGETAAIEYSIYYNGDPELGTVTVADGVPTFTPAA